VKKSDREIMEILEAFDATGCAHSAAQIDDVKQKWLHRDGLIWTLSGSRTSARRTLPLCGMIAGWCCR
jgi:hypothetical protein